jgi:secreted PhoX family phosphatase
MPMTAGDIYTVAGVDLPDFSGSGLPAADAEIAAPTDPATDEAGDLAIADNIGNRMLLVPAGSGTSYGRSLTAGHLYSLAGTGISRGGCSRDGHECPIVDPSGIAIDSHGNVVIANTGDGQIQVMAASAGTFYGQTMVPGTLYTVAANIEPWGVALDSAGNIVFADVLGSVIRVLAESTGTFYGQSMTAGDIYTVAGNGTRGFSGDGGPATSAELDYPSALTVDSHGNLVFADGVYDGYGFGNGRIRVVAESTGTFYGVPMTAGDIYTVAGNGSVGFSGDGGPATSAALNNPLGVAVDPAGNLVIADTGNNRIRVVANSTGTFYGVPMSAGDIYAIAGNGSPGFSGDGGPAASAELHSPEGLAVNAAGDIFVADTGNSRIREITG